MGTTLAFSTKAGTLATLQGVLKTARIPPLVRFTVAEWASDRRTCLEKVADHLGPEPWIVRSSCRREDGVTRSNAGAFLSLPRVTRDDLECAVERVIESYRGAHPKDEVLVQPMLTRVVRAGVAFSHDPNTCAPYRVINWSEDGETATVTGGFGGRVWQQAARSSVAPPPALAAVIQLVEELLHLSGGVPLD